MVIEGKKDNWRLLLSMQEVVLDCLVACNSHILRLLPKHKTLSPLQFKRKGKKEGVQASIFIVYTNSFSFSWNAPEMPLPLLVKALSPSLT